MFQQVYACWSLGSWKDCIMHCRRYHNIHCLWKSRFVPCAFDCDAERRLLLHTPTFSARPGVDGLETFSLFFYSSLFFFFFKDWDWRCSALNLRLLCDDCKIFCTGITDGKGWFEVSLLTWLSSKILCHKNIYRSVYGGGGREKEMKRRKNRWRHSTSLLK